MMNVVSDDLVSLGAISFGSAVSIVATFALLAAAPATVSSPTLVVQQPIVATAVLPDFDLPNLPGLESLFPPVPEFEPLAADFAIIWDLAERPESAVGFAVIWDVNAVSPGGVDFAITRHDSREGRLKRDDEGVERHLSVGRLERSPDGFSWFGKSTEWPRLRSTEALSPETLFYRPSLPNR